MQLFLKLIQVVIMEVTLLHLQLHRLAVAVGLDLVALQKAAVLVEEGVQ